MNTKNTTNSVGDKNLELIKKVQYLDDFLKTQDLDIAVVLHEPRKNINNFYKENEIHDRAFLKKLAKYFYNVSFDDLINDDVTVKDLPKENELKIQQKTKKIRILSNFLKEKEDLTFARAMSISDQKAARLISGYSIPNKKHLQKIAHYFFLDDKYLLDDNVDLPNKDELVVDEDLVSIQRNDIANVIAKNKNKHYISRSFSLLGHGKRVKLLFSLLLTTLPLIAYTAYSANAIVSDRISTMSKYKDDDGEEFPDEDLKNMPENEKHVDVKIGSQLNVINGIDTSGGSFNCKMRLWFDFDQLAYHQMFYQRTYNQDISTSEFSEKDKTLWSQDNWTYHFTNGNFTKQPDNIPDIIEMKDVTVTNIEDAVRNPLLLEETSMYPGTTSSNVYPNNETMWIVGNGSISIDTHIQELNVPYKLTNKTSKEVSYRYFQKSYIVALVGKSFDNPRYPLDSAQFHIYIQPMHSTTAEIRYVPTDLIDLTREQTFANNNSTCSIDQNLYETGTSPYFGISGGYSLIKSKDYKSIVHRLYYIKDNDDQLLSRTEYEILVRANRQGMSLFLQAFINLFSVVIWITIAFYNQAYNSEDAIGMLGTGLFGAISSILVGISMISDANMFSLITMVNIFTLAVIMIMTWESIAAKRANILKDQVAIAYRGIKLRILCVILIICTLIMFIGLPLASYIWEFGTLLF
jgi:transcriptional regulator with XRE-family HTH domain